MNNQPFRLALRKARKEAGYSQADLAKMVGCGQQCISSHETGATTPAEFRTLRKYEAALGIPARDLFPDIFNT